MLLAIDTSTAVASVALYDDRVLAESTWIAGQDHSRQLLPRIEALLTSVERTVDDVTVLGVAVGPGSFNGLRVGIATAKAFAAATGRPIVGVQTLQAMAYQFRTTFRPVRPLFPAGRDEVATALYQASEQIFGTLEEPRLTTLATALRDSPPDTFFCGELRPTWCEVIAAERGPDRFLPRAAEDLRRAGYLAELAWQAWRAGLVSDVATLEPLYLRRPAITGPARAIGSASP
jgi:tRNA threonylcarbamoyladenosine biosynthesis protein TsaB